MCAGSGWPKKLPRIDGHCIMCSSSKSSLRPITGAISLTPPEWPVPGGADFPGRLRPGHSGELVGERDSGNPGPVAAPAVP